MNDDFPAFCLVIGSMIAGIENSSSLSYSEYLKIDREVPPISEDILIFGGSAATYELPSISADIIAKGHPRTSEGMAVILYSGEDLHFTFDYVLGWQALGKEITVTGTLDKRIKMMDDVTPGEIYNKYLGTGLSIRETNVFPLIVYEDGIEYIRMPREIHNDGSMTMFVDIPEGTKARLSYGDKNTILDLAKKYNLKVITNEEEIIKILKQRFFENRTMAYTMIDIGVSKDRYYRCRDLGIRYARDCAIQLGLIKIF